MTHRGYQKDYSALNEEMHSEESRRRKAETMRLVLSAALGRKMSRVDVLNLGCSTGLIDVHLAPHVRTMTGIDIDEPGIEAAQARESHSNLHFELGDAMALRFADASFDVVICSQVYEHVPDSARMMSEIERVLRPGGVCYFAATNRWAVMEKHYFLPFLSWLPASWANRYVRWTGKADAYYERHLGVGGLRRIASAFRIDDWTGRILEEPKRFGADYMLSSPFSRLGSRILFRYAYRLFPGFIWLLWKAPRE